MRGVEEIAARERTGVLQHARIDVGHVLAGAHGHGGGLAGGRVHVAVDGVIAADVLAHEAAVLRRAVLEAHDIGAGDDVQELVVAVGVGGGGRHDRRAIRLVERHDLARDPGIAVVGVVAARVEEVASGQRTGVLQHARVDVLGGLPGHDGHGGGLAGRRVHVAVDRIVGTRIGGHEAAVLRRAVLEADDVVARRHVEEAVVAIGVGGGGRHHGRAVGGIERHDLARNAGIAVVHVVAAGVEEVAAGQRALVDGAEAEVDVGRAVLGDADQVRLAVRADVRIDRIIPAGILQREMRAIGGHAHDLVLASGDIVEFVIAICVGEGRRNNLARPVQQDDLDAGFRRFGHDDGRGLALQRNLVEADIFAAITGHDQFDVAAAIDPHALDDEILEAAIVVARAIVVTVQADGLDQHAVDQQLDAGAAVVLVLDAEGDVIGAALAGKILGQRARRAAGQLDELATRRLRTGEGPEARGLAHGLGLDAIGRARNGLGNAVDPVAIGVGEDGTGDLAHVALHRAVDFGQVRAAADVEPVGPAVAIDVRVIADVAHVLLREAEARRGLEGDLVAARLHRDALVAPVVAGHGRGDHAAIDVDQEDLLAADPASKPVPLRSVLSRLASKDIRPEIELALQSVDLQLL